MDTIKIDIDKENGQISVYNNGKGIPIAPYMSAGATDGSFFREAGMPVYGMDGSWGITPEDERAHGLDERMAVRALYDNVLFWELVLKALAGK